MKMNAQVVWESIRPDTFVYEPGPEPPVVVKPMTLHKDMHSLVGNPRFSDIQFRFQVHNTANISSITNTACCGISSSCGAGSWGRLLLCFNWSHWTFFSDARSTDR